MLHPSSLLYSFIDSVLGTASFVLPINFRLTESMGAPLELTTQLVNQVNGIHRNKLSNQLRRLALNYVTPTVPLSWVATTPTCPYANLGDALSPVIVSALSGLPIVHRHFDSRAERFACVGTIGQQFKNGVIHFWGTGVDGLKNPVAPHLRPYQFPSNTTFQVHALRGPVSASIFEREGVEVPKIYGDPVWFLPSIIQPSQEKSYELGVVVHLTELAERTTTASTHERLLRYRIPPEFANSVRIINTLIKPTFQAIERKVQEITACKRILSTSLHGLVIAEAYNIPCLYLRNWGRGTRRLQLEEETEIIDQRMRDFYRGVGQKSLVAYAQRYSKETDWENVIRAIDTHWRPLDWNPRSFLEAFPLPLKFNPLQTSPLPDRTLFNRIPF
jgi:pyruvyltransferase